MTYRSRPASSCRTVPVVAGESGGGYDPGPPPEPPSPPSPLERMADVLDEYEQVKRRMLEVWRDVAAWGGVAQTTGHSQPEWLALQGRLGGAEHHRLELLARRLPALPVTAALLADGQLSFDQAATIAAGTTRLSGATLAEVEQAAATAAAARNSRGDHPDVAGDVDRLVQERRKPADQDRLERRQVEGARLSGQADIFGGGRLWADYDPEGWNTVWGSINDAAGPPTPDTSRANQRAEGLVAMSRAWLAGKHAHPLHDRDPAAPGGIRDGLAAGAPATGIPADGHRDADDVGTATLDWLERGMPWLDPTTTPADLSDFALGAATGKPTVVVKVDLTDATPAAFAKLWRTAALSRAPLLGARTADVLACNANLVLALTDGARPLAELKQTAGTPTALRRQVLLRDLGCRWPGCTSPPAHCDVHHLNQDPTDHRDDNLVSLCLRHHRKLHSTHWHAQLDTVTGRLDLRRSPNGRVHHTTYPHATHPAAAAAATAATSGGDPPEVA